MYGRPIPCSCFDMKESKELPKKSELESGIIDLGSIHQYPVDDSMAAADNGPLTSREGRLHGGYPSRRLDW